MKIRKILPLSASLLLASCALGANAVSKTEFKRILEEEVKPTLVQSTKTDSGDYYVIEGRRNISNKTLIQDKYEAFSTELESFSRKESFNKDMAVSYSHSQASYVTKEIITSSGVKAFSDVEKIVNTTIISLNNDPSTSHLTTLKEVFHTNIKTDYLSIELDPITANIASAEIIIDNNIYEFNTEKVVYDKFTKKKDGGEEEEEDETIENPVISLAGTEWTLEDTQNRYKKVVISIDEGADKIASKDTPVGTIKCEEELHDLYIFEKEEGSYNFEIREVTETEEQTVLSDAAYDPEQADFIQTVVTPEIEGFYANAELLEIEQEILGKYQAAYDYMKNTVDADKNIEILERVAGMVFRVNDAGNLKELLLSKLDKDSKTRRITEITEREGFEGNIILTTEFEGF